MSWPVRTEQANADKPSLKIGGAAIWVVLVLVVANEIALEQVATFALLEGAGIGAPRLLRAWRSEKGDELQLRCVLLIHVNFHVAFSPIRKK